MDWLKDRKHKIMVSLLVGLAAALLAAGMPGQIEKSSTLAWWGVMYPRFCFAEPADEQEGPAEGGRNARESTVQQDSGNAQRKVKISFWLAKALDW